MSTANVNGVDLYFERSGAGDPLLFLNGSGSTLATSAPIVAAFSEHFDVLAFDQRGLGRSPLSDAPYEMVDLAGDAAALAEHAGWDRYRVFGVSFGGMLGQELAIAHSDRIDRLVLACTSAGGDGGSSYPLHTLADKTPDERAEIGMRILDTRFTPAWLAEHDGDRALADAMASRRNAVRSDAELRGEQLQMAARSRHDTFDRLDRITCPTLVACGRYDGIAPLVNGEAIASRIPGAVLRAYEGGHAFFYQDRRAFPEMIEFLSG